MKIKPILKSINTEKAKKVATRVVIAVGVSVGSTLAPLMITPDYYDATVIEGQIVNEADDFFTKYKIPLTVAINDTANKTLPIDNIQENFIQHVTEDAQLSAKIIARTREKYKENTEFKMSVVGAAIGLALAGGVVSTAKGASRMLAEKYKDDRDEEKEI